MSFIFLWRSPLHILIFTGPITLKTRKHLDLPIFHMEKEGPQSIVDLNDLIVMDGNTENLSCGFELHFFPKITSRQSGMGVRPDSELMAVGRIQKALCPQQAVKIPCVRILIGIDSVLRRAF